MRSTCKLAVACIVIAGLASCRDASYCELCGRWQSHAERTLQEMEAAPALTEARRRFYRDGFFGRLVVESTATHSRAWFPDEDPDDVPWTAWEVTAREGATREVRFKDPESGEWRRRSLRLEGDCYRIDQPELGFGEWFCRKADDGGG